MLLFVVLTPECSPLSLVSYPVIGQQQNMHVMRLGLHLTADHSQPGRQVAGNGRISLPGCEQQFMQFQTHDVHVLLLTKQ